jgi:hypothetical protein
VLTVEQGEGELEQLAALLARLSNQHCQLALARAGRLQRRRQQRHLVGGVDAGRAPRGLHYARRLAQGQQLDTGLFLGGGLASLPGQNQDDAVGAQRHVIGEPVLRHVPRACTRGGANSSGLGAAGRAPPAAGHERPRAGHQRRSRVRGSAAERRTFQGAILQAKGVHQLALAVRHVEAVGAFVDGERVRHKHRRLASRHLVLRLVLPVPGVPHHAAAAVPVCHKHTAVACHGHLRGQGAAERVARPRRWRRRQRQQRLQLQERLVPAWACTAWSRCSQG